MVYTTEIMTTLVDAMFPIQEKCPLHLKMLCMLDILESVLGAVMKLVIMKTVDI